MYTSNYNIDNSKSTLKIGGFKVEFGIPEGFQYVNSGSNSNLEYQIFNNGNMSAEVHLETNILDSIDNYLENELEWGASQKWRKNYMASKIKSINVNEKEIKYIEYEYHELDQNGQECENQVRVIVAAYDFSNKYRYKVTLSSIDTKVSIDTIKDFFIITKK